MLNYILQNKETKSLLIDKSTVETLQTLNRTMINLYFFLRDKFEDGDLDG